MPRLMKDKPRPKPWQAARRRDYVSYFLGYFATREEAAEREAVFDAVTPSQRGNPTLKSREGRRIGCNQYQHRCGRA